GEAHVTRTRVVVLTLVLALFSVPGVLAQTDHWVGTWTNAVVVRPATPQLPGGAGRGSQGSQSAGGQPGSASATTGSGPSGQSAPPAPPPLLHFNNQTLRQIVRTTIGGDRLRVVFSNVFGSAPLTIGAAHVALRDKDAAIAPKSDRVLLFAGQPTTTIP